MISKGGEAGEGIPSDTGHTGPFIIYAQSQATPEPGTPRPQRVRQPRMMAEGKPTSKTP